MQLNAQSVRIEKQNEQWELLVDNEPFKIKGATFGYTGEVKAYPQHFQELQFLGVNTIRIWATNEYTLQLLDAAHAHGIKVMVGIWMRHGRPGMEDDDRFDYLADTEGMEQMYADALQTVRTYKEHPAVLSWGVGNEVYLNTATDAEKETYSKLLERICYDIKELDVNHPIISVEAWTFGLDWWEHYVPSIDIYGLNSYGPGAAYLADELTKRKIDKPYIITEFGVTGEWDIQDTENGIKVEPNDKQKYNAITIGYQDWISSKPNCLGVYVFNYANGDDFGAVWLNTHYRTKLRPAYWGIRAAFTGEKPLNAMPIIEKITLPKTQTNSGTWVPIDLAVIDKEGEELEISFYYNQRTGSRKRRNQLVPLQARGNLQDGFELQLPPEDGPIKVYVNAADTYGNVGIASTSIVVKDEAAAQVKYKVPKAKLPFYIYNEAKDLPYYPSGYMGNYKAIKVDLANTEEVYEGETALKIAYQARDDWYGVAFVDPANDWGDILGGYDISGARTFSFWAKSSETKLKVTVGFGLIEDDKPFPDTDKKSTEIILTDEWKKYTIKTKNADLSCIRSGFVLFAVGNGFPHAIYLDNIVFVTDKK